MKTYRIDKLLGLDRNHVRGQAAPTTLYNLIGDRAGGYRPLGDTNFLGVTLSLSLIGYDGLGYSSFQPGGNYELFDGSIVSDTDANGVALGAVADTPVHLPSAGGYSQHNNFAVYDTDGNVLQDGDSAATIAVTGTGSGNPITYVVTAVNVLSTRAGLLATQVNIQEVTVETGQTLNVTETLPSAGNYHVQVYLAQGVGELPLLAKTLSPGDGTVAIPTEEPISTTIGDNGLFLLTTCEKPLALHQGRVWSRASFLLDAGGFNATAQSPLPTSLSDFSTILIYTEIGWANLMTPANFIRLRPLQSTHITALASAPGGLLVFMDNETHIIYGDPALDNLQAELYTAAVGADDGTVPARLGSEVFTIWKGNIYHLAGGRVTDIGSPVYLASDLFIQVVAEPQTKTLIGRTSGGNLFRYDLERGIWTNNTTMSQNAVVSVLPNPDEKGTRYADGFGNVSTLSTAHIGTPKLGFSQLDLEYPFDRKMLRYLRIPMAGYSGTATLSFTAHPSGQTGSVTGDMIGDELIFTLPSLVGVTFDLLIDFAGADADTLVAPPLEMDYVPRGINYG